MNQSSTRSHLADSIPQGRVDILTADLTRRGLLASDEWRRALHEVPRHAFVPHAGWACPDGDGGKSRRIDRDRDAAGWWEAVYSDTSVVTQADDGATDPTGGEGEFTSSISAPGVVTAFLDLLDVRDHQRVLEIGTGTGWTAALLSWRVGAANVSTIEVDAAVASQAAANLKAAGFAPRLLVGDGADGSTHDGPYDRIHVTCGVARVPPAWLSLVRPGGVIVLPLAFGLTRGQRVQLTVVGEGEATGSFAGSANYMMLRSQRRSMAWNPHHSEDARRSLTRLDPREIVNAGPGADIAVAARAPGVGAAPVAEDGGGSSLLLFEPGRPEGSWAACDYEPGEAKFKVTQHGSRSLWDEVFSAYLWWLAAGRPSLDRFRLTVSAEAQTVWLDHPERCVSVH